MSTEVLTVLGLAVTLAVAAIAGQFALLRLIMQQQEAQATYRHDLRNELQTFITNSEARLSRRLEILEANSIGYRNRFADGGTGNHGDG